MLHDRRFARPIFFTASLAVFILHFFNFKQPSLGYWDTYIIAPAAIMTGNPVDFVDEAGASFYRNAVSGKLPDDLISTDFGIATRDQRFYTPVMAAPILRLLGILGLRVLHALLHLAIFLLAFLVAMDLFNSRFMASVASLLFTLNPFILSVDTLNPNTFALAILLGMLHLLLTFRNRGELLAAGILYGAAGGLREEAVLIFPAIIFLLVSGRKEGRISALATFLLGGFAAVVPLLHFKLAAFGNPFLHPSQYGGFDGFRPVFTHSIAGMSFGFNGLLNYPFHSQIVRTPHFAFPVFLLWPLVFLRSFGTLLSAAGIAGLARLFARERRVAIFLVLWTVPIYLLFAFQENWEEVKMTFILLAFIPSILFIVAGMGACRLPDGRHDKGRPGRAIFIAATAVMLTFVVRLLGLADFSEDTRWYERFPHAAVNSSGITLLDETQRNEWVFFHTRESPDEYAREKKKLTAGWPVPMPYLPVRLSIRAGEIPGEAGNRNVTLPDTWRLIYTYAPAAAIRGRPR